MRFSVRGARPFSSGNDNRKNGSGYSDYLFKIQVLVKKQRPGNHGNNKA